MKDENFQPYQVEFQQMQQVIQRIGVQAEQLGTDLTTTLVKLPFSEVGYCTLSLTFSY